MIRKSFRVFIVFIFFLSLTVLSVCAQEAVFDDATFVVDGFSQLQALTDGNQGTYTSAGKDNSTITVSRTGGIGALYIEFDRIPKEWTLTNPASGTTVTCGTHAFLHEYVDVSTLFGTLPESLVMSFPNGTSIADIYAFSSGELPDWVQVWQAPLEKADLLLLSTHSDDEQLFFAGILPYYTQERNLRVQVVYAVHHFDTHSRPHEQLDGLWTVGVRHYPVISEFPDLYASSKDRATAFAQAKDVFASYGVTYDDFVGYLTSCLRRFEPLVVVSHDLDGEYGHGAHVLVAAALTDAIVSAADPEQYPDSAAQYGTWTPEKTYLHLYPENTITMDWDTPLDSLGGKTPFEVTQEGFGCHKSQHWTWFKKWIYGTDAAPITKASDIKTYSPCLFGLYDTKVGLDTVGGDFFENVETYEARELATKAAAEAEEARLKAEAEAKAKAEAEEAARQQAEEEARQREEEAKRKAEEDAAAKAEAEKLAAQRKRVILISCVAAAAILLACILLVSSLRHGKNNRGKRSI